MEGNLWRAITLPTPFPSNGLIPISSNPSQSSSKAFSLILSFSSQSLCSQADASSCCSGTSSKRNSLTITLAINSKFEAENGEFWKKPCVNFLSGKKREKCLRSGAFGGHKGEVKEAALHAGGHQAETFRPWNQIRDVLEIYVAFKEVKRDGFIQKFVLNKNLGTRWWWSRVSPLLAANAWEVWSKSNILENTV